MSQDEGELVRRAQAGDAQAYGELYRSYMQPIYRYILFRVSSAQEAEDLTEEVFVRAWEALPKYTYGKYPFKSWLYRIAHNLVIDHRRKKQPISVDPDDLLYMQSEKDTAEQTIQKKNRAKLLAQALEELDDTERQIIVLRFVEERSHREVAEIVGITEGSSRVVQHRALKKLRDILKDYGLFND